MRAKKVHAEKSAKEKCTQNGLNKKKKDICIFKWWYSEDAAQRRWCDGVGRVTTFLCSFLADTGGGGRQINPNIGSVYINAGIRDSSITSINTLDLHLNSVLVYVDYCV